MEHPTVHPSYRTGLVLYSLDPIPLGQSWSPIGSIVRYLERKVRETEQQHTEPQDEAHKAEEGC